MNFLLKIVEGPNKGAEIALVSGIAVTLGKSDDCDIVLADTTLPSTPVSIEATESGVTVDGESLEPFTVKSLGSTSFAIGPADAPWSALKRVEKVEPVTVAAEPEDKPTDAGRAEEAAQPASSPAPSEGAAVQEEDKKRSRTGCGGCLAALAIIIFALLGIAWFLRATIREFCESRGYDVSRLAVSFGRAEEPVQVEEPTLADVAARYGLSIEESDGSAKLSGNLKTRAERLRATAEAYEVHPGVDLDLSDDESFRTASEDALFTLTEGRMTVVSATNRVLAISGTSSSPIALKCLLKALDADLLKLRDVDVTGVVFGSVPGCDVDGNGQDPMQVSSPSASRAKSKKTASSPSLPVCGILTKPYPCLVMRDGARVLEGAVLDGNVIMKIEADAVTVTNSTGRFTWKP